MKRITIAILLAALSVPAYAGFQGEQIDEGLYFVWYERGRWTAGTVLDTARKARRKLDRKSNNFCLEQGYDYKRFLTLGEISRDDDLLRVWQLAAGDESADSYQIADSQGNPLSLVSKTHKSMRLLALSGSPEAGFERCILEP